MVKKKRIEVFIDPQQDMSSDSSSEGEIEVIPVTEEEVEEPVVKTKPKKVDGRKRPRTEAEKKKLREQLARGREKSRATRDKNNQLKRLKKKQAEEEKEQALYQALKKKENSKKEKNVLISEIEDLKNQINEMKKKRPKTPPPPPPKQEPKAEVKPKPKPKPKLEAEPEPEPVYQRSKPSNMDILKMLKSVSF